MKRLLKILDGNKTIVSLLLMRFIGMDFMVDALGPELYAYAVIALDILFGGAVAHHGLKGKFSASSN